MIRLFVLSRYTPKSIKAIPGVDPKHYPAIHTTGSNIYNTSELCLLSWLSYHHTKVNPADKTPITNFDTDLHDCRVYASAIISHVVASSAFGWLIDSNGMAVHANHVRLEGEAGIYRNTGLYRQLSEPGQGPADDW